MINNIEDRDGVIRFFKEICAIPHGSGNEKQISDYLVGFAKERGLWVRQDQEFNVIIKKKASLGYENANPVIIQGHMDMVCEKNKSSDHNFITDGIQIITEGDFIMANKTTLGADNGIGVAYALALLDSSEAKHPALEIMLTTNEETGMDGAKAIDPQLFEGRRLINLDNEDESICFVSCAGGLRCDISVPNDYESVNDSSTAFQISIGGLLGGHSGMAIHKQHCNAIRIMMRLLSKLEAEFDINITAFSGGSKDNVIPREASCVVVLNEDSDKVQGFLDRIKAFEAIYRGEFKRSDPNLEIKTSNTQLPDAVLTKNCALKVIAAGLLLPCGVLSMSMDIDGLVESSANIGVLKMCGDSAENTVISTSLRSSVASLKSLYSAQIRLIADLIGVKFGERGNYPAWEYAPVSPLRELYINTYKTLFNEDVKISAIHAGLECGVFAEKFPGMDMISIGPNMYGVHSPDEKLSISSTLKVWELLKTVLANMR